MEPKVNSHLGYYGPEWDKKIHDRDNPNFWKYGVANLIFLDFVKDKKMTLDIGCGTGGSTLFLAEHAQINLIVGIDPTKSMIQVAKKNTLRKGFTHKTDFLLCDGKNLPFKQSCFDALVSRGDAFVFLVPQKRTVQEFSRVLKSGAVLVIEIDNVRWKPGEVVSLGFERLIDGTVMYYIEYFDVNRNHTKVSYLLNPQSEVVKEILENEEFIKKGRLKCELPVEKVKEETVEIRYGPVTHWPTVNEMKMLFNERGFRNIEVLGDGLLMGVLREGDERVIKEMKKRPQLFFEIEKKLIQFIDPEKANTIILKAIKS